LQSSSPISEKLDTKTLQELKAKVDMEGQLEGQVAEESPSKNGFI
jgi:glycine betaine/choline ABC-type transport system substrate-binding protein